jgi:hypothetical protein
MTDGDDTQSTTSLEALVKTLGGEDQAATVFTIGYGPAPSTTALGAIAKAGAGSFSQGDVKSIIQVYRDLASFF